jgi:hypothetical protein
MENAFKGLNDFPAQNGRNSTTHPQPEDIYYLLQGNDDY